jgi:hypothetical protein
LAHVSGKVRWLVWLRSASPRWLRRKTGRNGAGKDHGKLPRATPINNRSLN